jgi:hypothetical protein
MQHDSDMRGELSAQTDEFFRAVSFERGQTPAYARIHDLFMATGNLINNTSELPEILSVGDFIASRERTFASGALGPRAPRTCPTRSRLGPVGGVERGCGAWALAKRGSHQ